jgi:large subunit ribosomal protein L18
MKKKSQNDKSRKWEARRRRVQSSLGSSDRPRLTVFRSAKHIYAQICEANTGSTLISVSTLSKGVVPDGTATGNVEAAKKVGAAIAQAARERKIESVVFNRNGFLYHGRVKALADAAREAGLQF